MAAFQFDFAFGVIAILLGLVVIIHPGNIMALVPVIMGIYFMIDGIMKIQTAVDAKRFGVRSWVVIRQRNSYRRNRNTVTRKSL